MGHSFVCFVQSVYNRPLIISKALISRPGAVTMMDAGQIDAVSVLKLLSDPQKIGILKELGKAKNGLAYSEIMQLTGLQSGRLGYQLRKLGVLVNKREEKKYEQTSQGIQALGLLRMAQALFPTAYSEYRLTDGSTLIARPTMAEDSEDLFEIEKSRQKMWVKSAMGEIHQARYEDLTPEEVSAQCGTEPSQLREEIRRDQEQGAIRFTGLIHGRPRASLRLVSVVEPDPWGKAAHVKIDVHKKYDDLAASVKLLELAIDTAKKMGHNKLDVWIYYPLAELEKHLDKRYPEHKTEYAHMRIETPKLLERIPSSGTCVEVRNAEDDPPIFRKLRMNRSLTWANQASDCATGECRIDQSKPSRDRLLCRDGNVAALSFYHRKFTNSTVPEIYLPFQDLDDENLIKELILSSAQIGEELSYQMLEVLVESRFRDLFSSLGFRTMKPETPPESLLGQEWVSGKGPGYVIDLNARQPATP